MSNARIRLRAVLKVLAVVALLSLVGVAIWRWRAAGVTPLPTAAQTTQPSDPEKSKPPIEMVRNIVVEPAAASGESRIKPNHWTMASLELRANHQDFAGVLRVTPQSDNGEPLPLVPGGAGWSEERPVLLPKGQTRRIEFPLYVPSSSESSSSVFCAWRLETRVGTAVLTGDSRLPLASDRQSRLLVLARSPDAYKFLNALDVVRAPQGELGESAAEQLFVPTFIPTGARRLELPADSLAWTSFAALVWDDRLPDEWSEAQRTALLDWLHWGGQIIVSGPDTLESLRGSFLDAYLPADSGGGLPLEAAELAALNGDRWRQGNEELAPREPLAGVLLRPRASEKASIALASGDAPLVVERSVGRGRVVVTAFRLSDQALVQWSPYDSVIHGALLRLPPRRFELSGELLPRVRMDALPSARDRESFERDAAQAAREVLHGISGVVVPGRWLVISILGAYVMLIAPLNWGFFRLVGRVQWAWFAAPLIAIAFTAIVAWSAQLDVGFSRARHIVSMVELQDGYPRARVQEYIALYNSLGTEYRVATDEEVTHALPIAAVANQTLNRGGLVTHASQAGDKGDGSALERFVVPSNTTAMLRAERMLPLTGGFEVSVTSDGAWQVINRSGIHLDGAVLIADRKLLTLGSLAAGDSAIAQLSDSTAKQELEQRAGYLAALVSLAAIQHNDDQLRLVGWNTTETRGFQVEPAARGSALTLVVAHLKGARFSPIQGDDNSRADIERKIHRQ